MLLIVSVIVWVVSVWLVIEPCVKFGTTGTAWAATAVVKTAAALVTIDVIVFPKRVITDVLNQLQ
ncbi:hypothetical protein SXBG_00130 [Synechococcus phage S-CAM1]|jgi:hypothetical protein|uniref:Uncharacterized protein n=1 Tax=Synechococcus phage S-CAM1 TaxID=754037 RepID=M4QHF9_9CAUD|nr:hypothetical protein SXBG_00130 [Synechococcus phage S-CAM1]AGH26866.1 hypothetical protein SXBG_00130 [Synechococcus phage S-CAM1]